MINRDSITRFITLVISVLLVHISSAQTLIINEVSNGPSGNMEYVEMVVVDPGAVFNCNLTTPPCLDIRGWIFDDNSGYHGAVGVAAGAIRFSYNPIWSCVPLGTIIVIYNNGDVNTAMPPVDTSLTDGNCRMIIPANSTLLEKNATTPGASACSYPATGWSAGGNWNYTLLANGGDCARIVNLAGCEVFSLCNGTANQNTLIYFPGNGQDRVWYFNDGDANLQANWTQGCADPTACGVDDQTPGAPNNAANAAYIAQYNNGCSPITPVDVTAASSPAGCSCDGTATATATGSIPGYTYVWYNNAFVPIGQTTATATSLCSGTYNVIATSSIGCIDTATVIVGINSSVPIVNAVSNIIVCNASTTPAINFTSNLAGATFSWTNSNSSIGLPAGGSGNISSFSAVNSTSSAIVATISVTATIAGCTGPATIFTITVNPSPTVNPVLNISACPGDILPEQNFSSTTTGTTFSWTNSNTSIGLSAGGTGNTPIFTAMNSTSSAITSTINVTPTSNGCTGTTSSYTITVNAIPDATIIQPSELCENGSPVTLSAITSGGTWSGPGISDAVNGTFDPDLEGAGDFIVSYSLSGSCIGTDTVLVIVNPVPILNPVSNVVVCHGDIVSSSVFSATLAGTTFSWTNSNTSIGLVAGGTGNTPAFTATNTTSSSVTSTVNVVPAANGCNGTTLSYTITVNPIPDATIVQPSVLCENNAPVNLSSVTPGGIWNGPGISDTINGVFDPDLEGAGAFIISYTISGLCPSTDTVLITVNPTPSVIVPPDITVCPNEPISAINFSTSPAGGTFTWTNTNSLIGLASNGIGNIPAFNAVNNSGTILNSIIAVVPSFNGCIGMADSFSITVNDYFDATINPAGPFCENSSFVSLSAIDGSGIWSGSGITDAANGIFDPSAVTPGNYTITYSIGGYCGDTATALISVLALADATINPVSTFCASDAAVNLSSVQPGGIWSGTGITDSINGIFNPSVAGAGNHTITYLIAGMCGDTSTIVITVVQPLSSTIVTIDPLCENMNPVQLIAANPGGNWISDCGTCITSSGLFTPSDAGAGTHTVIYSITGVCGSSDTIQVVVNPVPVVSIIGDTITGCAPLAASFYNGVNVGGDVAWFINGTFVSNDPIGITQNYTVPGCYDITLNLTSTDGCSSSLTLNNAVCVADDPVADFTFSPSELSTLNTHVNFINSSQGAVAYQWNFNGLDSSSLINPSFDFPPIASGYTVCLTAINTSGCVDSVCKPIVVAEDFVVYVPNAFSPNGDGKNDIFVPVVNGVDAEDYEFVVLNRWGEVVFITNVIDAGWDGTQNGSKVKSDIYVWKMKAKKTNSKEIKVFYGHVNLLR